MAELKTVNFSGDNSYTGVYFGTAIDFDEDDPNTQSRNPMARVFGRARPSSRPTRNTADDRVRQTLTVQVAAGATLFGAGSDNEGDFPDDMQVEVVDPDGNKLNTVRPATDPTKLVDVDASGVVRRFLIRNAKAGTWTINLTVKASADDVHYFVSTLPTSDLAGTIATALQSQLPGDQQVFRTRDTASSLTCWLCQAALWTLAIGIAALVGISLVLDPEAVPVEVEVLSAALSKIDSIPAVQKTTAAIITTLKVLFAQEGLRAVPDTIASVCMWMGACAPSVSTTLTAPTGAQTGTVSLAASAVSAATVVFLLDGTSIGTASAPSFTLQWDSKSASNGAHTLAAVGIDGSRRVSLSSSAPITVQN